MNGHKRHGTVVEILETSEKNRGIKNLSKRRLKRVFTIRWNSKSASCITLNDCFREVITCLDTIANDKTMPQDSVTSASGLKKRMLTFDFIATLKICLEIFGHLLPVTVILQGTAMDFGSVTAVLNHTIGKLNDLRTVQGLWDNLKERIFEACEDFGVEIFKKKRIIHRKRFLDEIGLNTYQPDVISKLKIGTFYPIIHSLLQPGIDGTHESLMRENCNTRAPLFCQHYNINIDMLQTEL